MPLKGLIFFSPCKSWAFQIFCFLMILMLFFPVAYKCQKVYLNGNGVISLSNMRGLSHIWCCINWNIMAIIHAGYPISHSSNYLFFLRWETVFILKKVFIDKLNRDLIGRITQIVTCTLHWKTWHKLINKTKYALIIIKNDDSWNMLQKDPTWLHELCDFFLYGVCVCVCVCVCVTVWRKRNHNGNGQSNTTPHGAI